ncbi:hypothetical protein C8R45DRAFT_1133466 [Mycena sanguinolenta]|nr:hypothetical protein C8R45DRAFT_1133466 [Mycena sanguinolenta]
MNKVISTATLLVAAAAASLLPQDASTGSSACTVEALVRAEDLAPDYVSHGELRIKVWQPHCADSIASVALPLELNEFGEVKHLRPGAVIPEIKKTDNQTLWHDTGGKRHGRGFMAFAWHFSRPLVKPFIVASPAVNYPPSTAYNYRYIDSLSLFKRHAYSNLGYHYTAIVNFTDGRTVHLPAGHTTFRPTSTRPLAPTPSSWNQTFSMHHETCTADLPQNKEALDRREKCLPESLRSSFIAEITLEDGNVVQRGQPLKGRVTVHATNGSTKMSGISLSFYSAYYPSWGIERATTGGDPDFYQFLCQYSHASEIISADYSSYLFNEEESQNRCGPTLFVILRHQHGALALGLTVVYPRDAADCVRGVEKVNEYDRPNDDLDLMLQTEERLWNSYTPINAIIPSEPSEPSDRLWERSLYLQAVLPLDVLGDISERQIDHYLTPGLPSPILFTSPPPDLVGSSFARPVITEEPLADTSARLMPSKGTFDPYQYGRDWDFADYDWPEAAPDPAAHYNEGNYVGLLWKKKVIAEEKGILPKTSAPQAQGNEGDSQRAFYVVS